VQQICLSHYACNFFVFAVTGLEFRRELRRTLCCRRSHDRTSSLNGAVAATEYSLTTVQPRPDERGSVRTPSDELQTFVPEHPR